VNLVCFSQEVDPTVETDDMAGTDGMDGLVSDLANASPGIDEAMSFAEMLK
jgi:arsenite-transporting ATPase